MFISLLSDKFKLLSKMMICLFKYPGPYLFQPTTSKYFFEFGCLQLYFIMLFLRTIVSSCRSQCSINTPFAPLQRICRQQRLSFSFNFDTISSNKFFAIFPMPSVKRNPIFEDQSSSIRYITLLESQQQEDENACPILAAFFAAILMSSNYPKKWRIDC